MKYATIALIGMVLLTGCSSRPFSYASPEYEALTLPDVVEYTPTQQKMAAKEMQSYCPNMPIVCGLFLPDYLVMRDQVRAARD
jgi:hypothetical protein